MTRKYIDFQLRQTEELLTHYGPLLELWIDIPGILGHEGRRDQYELAASLQPKTLVMMNAGLHDGLHLDIDYAWPTDLMAIERRVPDSELGYCPVFEFAEVNDVQPNCYYLPGEACETAGRYWFHHSEDQPREPHEILGLRLLSETRGVNFLLNVSPDVTGCIPHNFRQAVLDASNMYDAVKFKPELLNPALA